MSVTELDMVAQARIPGWGDTITAQCVRNDQVNSGVKWRSAFQARGLAQGKSQLSFSMTKSEGPVVLILLKCKWQLGREKLEG